MFALSSPPEKFVSLEEKLITPLVLVDTRWIFLANREQYNSLNKCTHTHKTFYYNILSPWRQATLNSNFLAFDISTYIYTI